jgi:hypothetical protein
MATAKLEVSLEEGTSHGAITVARCYYLGQGFGAGPPAHWKLWIAVGAVRLQAGFAGGNGV